MEDEKNVVVIDDDTELDKELESTLNTIRTENSVAPVIEEKPEVVTTTPPEQPKEEPSSPAPDPADDPNHVISEEFKTPKKGKFESEESYQKRLDLSNLVQQRKLAKTDEEKQRLSENISNTRKELSTLNHTDKIINQPNKGGEPIDDGLNDEERTAIENDRKRLKELGGATKEDIQEMLQNERIAIETKATLENFVERHPELKDEDTREVFFGFVENNYKWQNKTGKELMTVLELARENMFKPSESIQERILKGANVAEKVNAMQFPGGTIVKPGLTSEQQSSLKELMSTGMSESKALELISE